MTPHPPSISPAFIALALASAAFIAPDAQAGIVKWGAAVGQGMAATFSATQILMPSVVDIGAVSGDVTYEFIVNGGDHAAAGTLIGSWAEGQAQAIRFEQWFDTGHYGTTQYSIADYSFSVPTQYDTDLVLAFVVNGAAQTTELFVNGAATGAFVPMALSLHDRVGVGGTLMADGSFLGDDAFAGRMLGMAVYDAALSAAELRAHADAFATAEVAEAPTLALASVALLALATTRRRLAAPAG